MRGANTGGSQIDDRGEPECWEQVAYAFIHTHVMRWGCYVKANLSVKGNFQRVHLRVIKVGRN